MHELLDSTAIAFVGRHNSGKTTIVCEVISQLASRGFDVGSVKHHGHVGFDIDVPGKDSYRHRAAGATECVVSSPDAIARIANVSQETECDQILPSMPGHDVVVVEGYRASGIPCIEVLRAGHARDEEAASRFAEEGFTPSVVGVVTNISAMANLATGSNLPVFDLPDVAEEAAFAKLGSQLADFIEQNYVREKVTVAIQAGGESKRMGMSKALVDFCGRPFISWMVERVLSAADEVLVTTNEADKLGFLHEMFPEAALRLVPDIYDERGALPGLVTALREASHPFVGVVACDMAFASAELLAYEAGLLRKSGADVAVPKTVHGFEPLHAVYRRDACVEAAAKLASQGSKRLGDLLDALNLETITPAAVRTVVPLGSCFANANTLEELAKLQELADSASFVS